MSVAYQRAVTASPSIGGPGRVEQVGVAPSTGETRNKPFLRQMAANSSVGAGMAADWEWTSELKEKKKIHNSSM